MNPWAVLCRDSFGLCSAAVCIVLGGLPAEAAAGAQGVTPAAPTIDTMTVGDRALTIAWGPPAGAADVTSYDLRYILTTADETVDGNWTVEQGVWDSGRLYRVLSELTNGAGYDVQVRAGRRQRRQLVRHPPPGTPAEHGGTLQTATSLPLDTTPVGGVIEPWTDVDYFTFTLSETASVVLLTTGELDTVGVLRDEDGERLLSNDDSPVSPNSKSFLIWDTPRCGDLPRRGHQLQRRDRAVHDARPRHGRHHRSFRCGRDRGPVTSRPAPSIRKATWTTCAST